MLDVAYGLCYGLFGLEHQQNESRNFGRSLQTVSLHLIWAVRYLVRTCLFYYFSSMFLGLHVINAIQCKSTAPSPGHSGGQFCKEHALPVSGA